MLSPRSAHCAFSVVCVLTSLRTELALAVALQELGLTNYAMC